MNQLVLEVIGVYCPVIKCVDAAASKRKTVGLSADFGEAAFTKTVGSDSSMVVDDFAMSAGIGLFLWETQG